MAHSLEAALVVPIGLTVMLGLAGQAWPIFLQSDQLARTLVNRQVQRLTMAQTYNLDEQGLLLTSPQHVVEWIETARQLQDMPEGKDRAEPQ